MAQMKDATDLNILVGDMVLFADSGSTDLVKGRVVDFGEKMVSIERESAGWPRKVRRYPNQVVVIR